MYIFTNITKDIMWNVTNDTMLNFFIDMLLQFNLIYADPPRQFTKSTKEVTRKLFENFIKMLGKCTIIEGLEYFLPKAQSNIEQQEEVTTSTCEEYVPPKKVSICKRVSFDIKLKIVMTANEHPQWF